MLEILLLRHGQTDWNKGGRVMGRRPIPINKVGRRDSELVAQLLKNVKVDYLYASPVLRAVQTARIVMRSRRIKLETAPELAEVEYGSWVGRTFEDVSREKQYRIYHTTPRLAHPPGGERLTDVQKRSLAFIEALKKRHRRGSVLLVTHADVIRSILIHYLNMDLNDMLRMQIDNGSLSILRVEKRSTDVVAVNYIPAIEKLFEGRPTDRIASLPGHHGSDPV